MSLLNRISTLLQAEANSVVDKLSDPSKEMDLSYDQMTDQLRKAQAALAQVVAQRITLDGKVREAAAKAQHAQANAKEALAKDREDLAREFLAQKQADDAAAAAAQSARDQVAAQEQALESTVQKLQARIAAYGTQKDVTKAQLTASKAQVQANQSLGGLASSINDAGSALARAQAKATSLQSQAQALQELTGKGILSDPTDTRTAAERELDGLRSTSSVDDELAALKAQIGKA